MLAYLRDYTKLLSVRRFCVYQRMNATNSAVQWPLLLVLHTHTSQYILAMTLKKAVPGFMQSHPLHEMCFGQYQASGDGDYHLMHKMQLGGCSYPYGRDMYDIAAVLDLSRTFQYIALYRGS